jgi:hypothetical protein
MDVPAAAAGPWIVLGVVSGLLVAALVVLGVLLARRTRSAEPAEPPPPAGSYRHDDLAGFLDSPPGSQDPAPTTGWASLAPTPRGTPSAGSAGGRETVRLLAAMVLTALVLVGSAAAVAAATGDEDTAAPERTSGSDADPAPDGELTADLSFGGVVLEPRAVGVTVTYPRVLVTHDPAGETRARVELPTWNCLTDTAPEDPLTAGCARSLTEVAELATPELGVSDAGELRLSGRFPTSVQPHGSVPEPTGRSYEIEVTVAEAGSEGTLRLGPETVGTTEGSVGRSEG